MPIAQELEGSLHTCFIEARQGRHEFITVEHLLLALLENPSAAKVLRACACNIEDLRKSLQNFVSDNTPVLPQSSEADTQPTQGFQHVIQRAIMHVQSTSNGMKEVTGADVLLAIFGEKDSHAVYYLHQQGVKRLDVVNHISHGITKAPQSSGKSKIAQELEVSLHMGFVEARQARHEFITVEHLLLALLDNPSAAEVLRACACNIEDLRESLQNFVSDNTPVLPQSPEAETQPTLGFQRVIQRAIMHVQSTSNGMKEVTGAHVLVAIFGEKGSHAVYYLHQQGVTRPDVVNFISRGIIRAPENRASESVVQAQVDAYNARDIRAFMATFASDAEIYEYPVRLLLNGADQIEDFYLNHLFNDGSLRREIVNRIVMGEVVIDHQWTTITFPEGPGRFEGVATYELRSGKIQKVTLMHGRESLNATQ